MLNLKRIPTQRLIDAVCRAHGWSFVKYELSDEGAKIDMYDAGGAPVTKTVTKKAICDLFTWKDVKFGEMYTDIEHLPDDELDKYFHPKISVPQEAAV